MITRYRVSIDACVIYVPTRTASKRSHITTIATYQIYRSIIRLWLLPAPSSAAPWTHHPPIRPTLLETSASSLSYVCAFVPLQKRVLTLPAFCHELEKQLSSKNGEQSLKNLTDELENQINAVKSYFLKSPGSHRHAQLDNIGTDLWNRCVQIKRQDDGEAAPERKKLLTLARVFSFLILALAQWGDHNTPGDLLRLEKLAIKAGRSCIGIVHLRLTACIRFARLTIAYLVDGELKFALMTLQKAAEYNGLLQNLQAKLPQEELRTSKRLETEYLTLRIALVSCMLLPAPLRLLTTSQGLEGRPA